MSVKPPSELKQLLMGLQFLADKRGQRQMANSLGAEVVALIKGGFDASTDPYGVRWAPVRRGGLPLRKTGRLKNAWTYSARAGVVGVENGLIQAQMMQHGTAGLPGGKLVPKNKKALRFDVPGAKKKRGTSWMPTVTVKSVVIPARRMVPEEGDFPEQWRAKLTATADRVLDLILKASGKAR